MDFLSQVENTLLEFLHSGKRILIITGAVNSGKTSAIKKIISILKKEDKNIDGFYSKGIFDGEKKVGFNIVDIKSGESTRIASINESKEFPLKQGRYFFNFKIFKLWNRQKSVFLAANFFVVDEIGYLELKDEGFYPLVANLMGCFKGKIILSIRQSILKEMYNKLKLDEAEIYLINL